MNSHKSYSLVPLPFCGPFPRWLACLQLSFQPLPCLYYWSNRPWFSLGKPTCLILFSFFLDSHTNFWEARDRLLPALPISPHPPLHSPKCLLLLQSLSFVIYGENWGSLSQLSWSFSFLQLKKIPPPHFHRSQTYWLPPQINKYVLGCTVIKGANGRYLFFVPFKKPSS